jgi:hypothetical protein
VKTGRRRSAVERFTSCRLGSTDSRSASSRKRETRPLPEFALAGRGGREALCQDLNVKSVVRPLFRVATYRRWTFLLGGTALLVPYILIYAGLLQILGSVQ